MLCRGRHFSSSVVTSGLDKLVKGSRKFGVVVNVSSEEIGEAQEGFDHRHGGRHVPVLDDGRLRWTDLDLSVFQDEAQHIRFVCSEGGLFEVDLESQGVQDVEHLLQLLEMLLRRVGVNDDPVDVGNDPFQVSHCRVEEAMESSHGSGQVMRSLQPLELTYSRAGERRHFLLLFVQLQLPSRSGQVQSSEDSGFFLLNRSQRLLRVLEVDGLLGSLGVELPEVLDDLPSVRGLDAS